jgi:hypothetical protein
MKHIPPMRGRKQQGHIYHSMSKEDIERLKGICARKGLKLIGWLNQQIRRELYG